MQSYLRDFAMASTSPIAITASQAEQMRSFEHGLNEMVEKSAYQFPFFSTGTEALAFLRRRNLRHHNGRSAIRPWRTPQRSPRHTPRKHWIVGVRATEGLVFVLHATKGWRVIRQSALAS